MKIAFTGTREGMNEYQLEQLEKILTENRSFIVYGGHGNCIGADVQFHKAFRRILDRNTYLAVFPSTSKRTRAPDPRDASYIDDPESPTTRDHTIVISAGPGGTLIAAPLDDNETAKSGTWLTVRYARKRKIKVIILKRKREGERA